MNNYPDGVTEYDIDKSQGAICEYCGRYLLFDEDDLPTCICGAWEDEEK